jgi:choline monooxygenase
MFTNQHHLEHLMRPEHYYSEEQHQLELRHVFHPAWHPLCTVHDLAKPGDFRTFNVCGTPVLLRNFDGELRAFLNVCPHRHSQITSKSGGNTPKLTCQYHGWEFTKDGSTGKIPDAKAFRPWDRENSCLTKFHIDKCAELIFVNLSDNPVSLRDWIGPLWELWQDYGGVYRYAATWEKEFPCNWKVVLENSLESYHVPQVHPETFKDYPPEENAWHELNEKYTTFRTVPPRDFAGRSMEWMTRRLGHSVKGEYWHRVLHPHTTAGVLDVARTMQCVFPTGPKSCLYRTIYFTLRGVTHGPHAWAIYKFLEKVGTYVVRRVFVEDGSIYGSVQRGMEASPHRGVIGTREERIYHFHKYVLDRTRAAKRELPQVSANGNGEVVKGCVG